MILTLTRHKTLGNSCITLSEIGGDGDRVGQYGVDIYIYRVDETIVLQYTLVTQEQRPSEERGKSEPCRYQSCLPLGLGEMFKIQKFSSISRRAEIALVFL